MIHRPDVQLVAGPGALLTGPDGGSVMNDLTAVRCARR